MTGRIGGGRLWLMVAFGWAVAAALMVAAAWRLALERNFPDADDYMRLQQVRDLLAGQNWFDTRQYRMNPPWGAPFHWSRVVDVPLAAVMLALRPLIGIQAAETTALIAVPLVTLGLAMMLIAAIARRLGSDRRALAAALLLPTIPTAYSHLRPLRIDHHGWQVVLGLVAARAMVDDRPLRSGILTGTACAFATAISLEALPFAAAVGLLCAVRWIIDPEGGERLGAFSTTLAVGAVLTYALTTPATGAIHCDSLTPPYLLPLVASAAGVAVARRLRLDRAGRLLALAVTAVIAAATFGVAAPQCLAGPLGHLDPVVETHWYSHVREGLPIWRQTGTVAAAIVVLPLLGLWGAALARRSADAVGRRNWAIYIFLLAASLAVAILVARANVLANILALPGAIHLAVALMRRSRGLPSMPARAVATVAAGFLILLLFPPAIPVTTGFALAAVGTETGARRPPSCLTSDALRWLDALPPSNLLTPLDIAPKILTSTRHRLLASGHHRNEAAMRDALLAMIGPPDAAREIIRRHRIDFVVACISSPETQRFRRVAPGGLWARLVTGRPPTWLEPPAVYRGKELIVWRVRDESGR